MSVKIRKRHEYSDMEARIMKFLDSFKAGTRVSTLQIVDGIYPRGEVPIHARTSVTSVMRILVQKVRANGERYVIAQEDGRGHTPTMYWRELRRQRRIAA